MAILPLLESVSASNGRSTGARSSSVDGVRPEADDRIEPLHGHEPSARDGSASDAAPSPEPNGRGAGASTGGDAASNPRPLPQGPEAALLALGLASRSLEGALAEASDASLVLPSRDATGAELAPTARLGSHAASSIDRHASDPARGASATAPSGRADVALRAESASLRLVERGMQALFQQRGGTLIMRLSPPELGVLEIRMTLEPGRLEVLFRPSNAEARRLLDGNLGMLRQSLERHGVGVGRLVVEPPSFERTEESARIGVGHSFDAGGRESRGRQEAERELRWRTEAGLLFGRTLRPDDSAGKAAEGPSTCPSSTPAPPPRDSFPAASAS